MMKILYVSHQHLPDDAPLNNIGGMQRVSVQLVRELKKRGDVKVIPVVMYARHERMGPPSSVFWIKTLFKLPFLAIRYRPDIILFSSMVTAGMVGIDKPFIRVPMVTINHGHDVTMPSPWYQFIWLPHVFRILDGTISVSQATREQTIKRGMRPDHALVVPNGFDADDWDLSISKKDARKILVDLFNLDVKPDTKILLSVGRQVKRKGHEWFIKEIFPKIKSDTIYMAIGGGGEHEHLLKVLSKFSYKNRIYLVGKQPDKVLQVAYAAADLFMMPNIPVQNDMEGFGVVMLEANINKTPAVASDLEGIKDVIVDGKNGYKIRVGDAKAFANKIDELCEDKNKLNKLQESSRQLVLDKFTWEQVADDYVQKLQFFIEESKHYGTKAVVHKVKTTSKKITNLLPVPERN